jgi:hypothetical protein
MRTGRDYRSNNQFNLRRAYSQGVVDRINNNFDSTSNAFRRISWDDAFRGWVPLHPVKDVRQQPSYQNSRMYKNENGYYRNENVDYSRRSQSAPQYKNREINKDKIYDNVSGVHFNKGNYWIFRCLQRKYGTQLKQDKGWRI